MRKLLSIIIILSLLFTATGISTAESNNVTSDAQSEEVSVTPEIPIAVSEDNSNPYVDAGIVPDLLSPLSITKDKDVPRSRFILKIKDEYKINDVTVTSAVYLGEEIKNDTAKAMLTNGGTNMMSEFSEEVEESPLENNLGNMVDFYDVNALENVNAVSMLISSEEVNTLLTSPYVESIEEDKLIESAKEASPIINTSIKYSSQSIPWGVHSTGAYIAQNQGITAEGIKIAVFDTGITEQADLQIAGGVSFVDGNDSYLDDNGHGTHIAGTIGATNNAIGILGAAPKANIYSVKVLNAMGTGYISSIIEGIDWAIDNGIKIINLSLAGTQNSELLHEAIRNANNAGILVISAAGNTGAGIDTIQYPAHYSEVIAVGAVDETHQRASFSSTGDEIDLMAPGQGVVSTLMNNQYGTLSGTSSAAAYVTGAAALVWSSNPSLSLEEVKELLYTTATPLGNKNEYGHGLVNVARALNIISGPIAPLSNESIINDAKIWAEPPQGDVSIASYDLVGDRQTIDAGDTATVSLKLEGDQQGQNPHNEIIVEVYSAADPGTILDTKTITNPGLNQVISFAWTTAVDTPAGTYFIKYRYPAYPNGDYDDVFIVYVKQPGTGPDTYENNDTTVSAKVIEEGQTYISYISSSTDVDYYVLNAMNTGELNIDQLIPQGTDYEMYAYDANGGLLTSSEHGAGVNEHVKFQVSTGSSYYIKIIGFSGANSTQPYTLNVGNIEEQPFPSPTGLNAVLSGNNIILSWDELPEAVSYKLQLNGTDVGTSATTSYTYTNLKSSTTYTLAVAAVFDNGVSEFSQIQASTSIAELFINQPENINLPDISYQIYTFKPASTGVYRIFTESTGDAARDSDTILEIYQDNQLTKLINSNDDNAGSIFSEIKASLIGGQTYYVKIYSFDETSLVSRITANVISSSIPYLTVDTPVDINEVNGSSKVYVFVPSASGDYKFKTSPYGGNTKSKSNDTVIGIYADATLEHLILNGQNDDIRDSVYSEVTSGLLAGVPYYVSINESNDNNVYARLLVSNVGQSAFTELQIDNPIDINNASGGHAYFQFTPAHAGTYRFFTTNYNGLDEADDTEIEIYADDTLEQLIDSNDDINGWAPYGNSFSKLEVSLAAGTTYYLSLSGYNDTAFKSRFYVEETTKSNFANAKDIVLSELIELDSYDKDNRITSLYDSDYYRITLASYEQLSLVLSKGEGTIYDEQNNIQGYFGKDIEQVFDLDAGTYYLMIESEVIHSNRFTQSRSFGGFDYDLSVDINIFTYEKGYYGEVPAGTSQSSQAQVTTLSASSDTNTLDATYGSGDVFKGQYKNKSNHNTINITVVAKGGSVLYRKQLSGNFKKDEYTTVSWNGEINVYDEQMYLYSRSTLLSFDKFVYWAKDGIYSMYVSSEGGKAGQEFQIKVVNDPTNKLNFIPPPPIYHNKKKITANDWKICKTTCENYYNKYKSLPGINNFNGYRLWFEEIYGQTALRKFWVKVDKIVFCRSNDIMEDLHCTVSTIGMIPVLGDAMDAADAVIYLIEGKNEEALISALAIIPVVGSGFAAAKKFNKLYKLNPCGCLPAGTKIKTKNGDVPIENIKIGDQVLAKDTTTGVVSYKPVDQLFSFNANIIYTIDIEGDQIKTTGNHPFWVQNKGWVTADELVVGDKLVTTTNGTSRVKRIRIDNEETQVYNFTVKDFNTYYISELGVLTHNLIETCNLSWYGNVKTALTSGVKSSDDRVILRAEIIKNTNIDPPDGWQAHHIVPAGAKNNEDAKASRDLLNDIGININSSANGVFLPKIPGSGAFTEIDGQTISTHNGRHTDEYFREVNKRLQRAVVNIPENDKARRVAAVLPVLEQIRKELLQGELALGKLGT